MPGFTSLGLGVPQASLFLNRRQDWKLLPPPSLSGLPGFQVRAARTFFCCIPEAQWQAQLRCWWQLTRTDARACLHMIPTLRGQRASLAFPRWPDWQLVEAGPSPRVVRCVWDYALSDRSPLELGFARACGEGLSHVQYLPDGNSRVVQWLRICLPMQETWVQSLVWEDSTCRGTMKPTHAPRLLKPTRPRARVQ